MKKVKNILSEFILPFVIGLALTTGCVAGWVLLWVTR